MIGDGEEIEPFPDPGMAGRASPTHGRQFSAPS